MGNLQVTGSTLSGNAEPLFSVSKQSSGSCYIDTAAQVWDVSEEETFPAKSIQDANEQPVYEAQLLKAADKPPLASLEVRNHYVITAQSLHSRNFVSILLWSPPASYAPLRKST